MRNYKTNILVFRSLFPLICLILWSAGVVQAQQVFVEGVVYNTEQEPLSFANVIGLTEENGPIRSFAITDSEGRFKIELDQDSSYLLKVSYLGYEDWSEIVDLTREYGFKTIVLQPAANNLSEVTVVYELPVAVSGDTISYRAEAFTTGKERKLKDVFEQLPGFEVGENGQIKVNGEKVDKLTVDGKDFFTGDTKLATNNIPANVVDKINLFNDNNSFTPMNGLGGDHKLAIDIRLKEGKQNIVFGSAEAGAGPEKRYLGHANVFYFRPKVSINFIGNVNNISQQVFSVQDYFRFNGGLNNLGKKSGVSMQLSSDELGLGLMKENKARNMDAKVGAFNFTWNPNSKLAFSGFAIASDLTSLIEDQASRLYIRQGNNSERLISTNEQGTATGMLKFNTRYTPHPDLHIEHDFMLKHHKTTEQKMLRSESDFDTRAFDADHSIVVPAFRQKVDVFYNENDKNVSVLGFSQQYNNKKTGYALATTEQLFPDIIPLNTDTVYNLFQDSRIYTHKMDFTLNHYYILNKTNHLNFTGGYTFSNQQLESGLLQKMRGGQDVDFGEDGLNNNVTYQFQDAFIGLGAKSKIGKLTINPGLTFHRFQLENTQLGNTESFSKYIMLPYFNAKYKFRKSISLKLDYSIQAEFFDVQQYAQNSVLRDYNDLFYGNSSLNNAWYHNLSLNYSSLNLFNFTNIYGMLSFQKKYDHINTRIIYNGLERVSIPVNVGEPNDFLSVLGAYERRFKFLKLDVNANLSYAKYNSLFEDNELTFNNSFTQRYVGSIETVADNFPVLEVGFKYIVNRYGNNVVSGQQYITNRPFMNIEVSFLKSFILVADYEYNWYKSKDSATSGVYDLLNAELYYKKKDSPFEFKIACLNLLDTKSIRQDFFSDALISTNEYFIQSRYFLGSLKYDF